MAKYRSKFEAKIAGSLTSRGAKFEYESIQLEYWLTLRGGKCGDCGGKDVYVTHWYTPDFILENGIIVEAKGRFTSKDRTKMLQVKKAHPELDIRMVFMADNKLHKYTDTRYSDWCKQNDFPFAIKEVPCAWFQSR